MECRFCKKIIKNKFLGFNKMPLANTLEKKVANRTSKYNLDIYFCSDCYYVQTKLVQTPKNIFFDDYPYQSSLSKTFLDHCKKYSSELIESFNINQKSYVIEIASNDGYMLNFFKQKKIPHLGIEPTKLSEHSINKGINTIKSFFDLKLAKSLTKKNIKADLIIANNVLAHVPKIGNFAKGIRCILKSNGIVVFEFPHLLNLLKNNLFDTIYHEHFSYLSILFLEKLFKKHNLKIFKVIKTKIHGGSLRVFVSHLNSINNIQSSVKKIIKEEKDFGLDKQKIYLKFSRDLSLYKKFVKKKIDKLTKSKKIIAGYGAAAKACTLLNFLEIDYPVIHSIYDKSPFKHNKYVPGTKVIIKDSKLLKKDHFDYLIIFPWNIKKEIMKDVNKVKNNKVKFITLIPSFEIF